MSAKILFVNTAVAPYIPDGRQATVGRALAQGMQELGHEVRTFMPRFGTINERRNQLHEVIRLSGMNLILNETDHPLIIKVASIQAARMQIYFIDNDDYFTHRNHLASTDDTEWDDNVERCIFYARGVIETIRNLRWKPDVVYCQGWFAALAPLYIKHCYADDPYFRGAKVVFAQYNDTFQTPLPDTLYRLAHRDGINKSDLGEWAGKPLTCSDLCKLGVMHSDALIVEEKKADPSVAEYAASLGRPVLSIPRGEVNLKRYEPLFQQLAAAAES